MQRRCIAGCRLLTPYPRLSFLRVLRFFFVNIYPRGSGQPGNCPHSSLSTWQPSQADDARPCSTIWYLLKKSNNSISFYFWGFTIYLLLPLNRNTNHSLNHISMFATCTIWTTRNLNNQNNQTVFYEPPQISMFLFSFLIHFIVRPLKNYIEIVGF